MPTILFYYPSNKRSVQIETTLIELKKLGNKIILLTTCEEGALHEQLKKHNIAHFSNPVNSSGINYYLSQIVFLVKFSKKNKVDFIFGNLQHANLIAVIAQYFTKAKVIAFRHHFKFSRGNFGIPLKINKNELLFDKIINRLAKLIIVPSKGVYEGILNHENINASKLMIIPYLYDFSQYGKPDANRVQEIKDIYQGRFRIIMVARLVPFKRHSLMLPIFKKLIDKGLEIQVLILDEGPEKETIAKFIAENKIEKHVHLIGYTKEFLNYMEACDLLVHPSITEASNNVVKEIGLLKKAVAVCRNVGDFDEYIQDEENGFLLDIENPQIEVERIIESLYKNPELGKKMGEKLYETIKSKFSNNSDTIKRYKNLLS
ncbi:glycosyltransferase family 4 protein [bacterium]|nr:glycosyltransferase family 4 protein [bacterium]